MKKVFQYGNKETDDFILKNGKSIYLMFKDKEKNIRLI